AGVGCLEHQGHRCHKVEQQALLALGVLALEGLAPSEHIAVEFEGPPRGCELWEMGMASAARQSCLSRVGWREVSRGVDVCACIRTQRLAGARSIASAMVGDGRPRTARDQRADDEEDRPDVA